MYHYAGNNPIKYTDPDGRQTAVPFVLPKPIPFALPRVTPIPLPTEMAPIPFLPGTSEPNTHYFEKPWDGDWHHAPNGPDLNDPNSNPLGDDWEPNHDANNKDPTGNKHFINKKTGEKARWDVPTEKDSKAHWHRENPNRSGANKYKKYLDPDGKPVKEDKSGAHIYPNPKMVPVIIA